MCRVCRLHQSLRCRRYEWCALHLRDQPAETGGWCQPARCGDLGSEVAAPAPAHLDPGRTVRHVPAATANGIGSDVQRPLATVVVGGLLSTLLLTLLALPSLYYLVEHRKETK